MLFFSVSCGTRRKSAPSYAVNTVPATHEPAAVKKPAASGKSGDGTSTGLRTISLLLPLKLQLMHEKSRLEIEHSSLSLDFYQGVRLALDSLSSQEPGLELNVLDTQDDSSHVSSILSKGDLEKSKLIIGPVYPSEIRSVTEYARRTHTWFISPLAPQALDDYQNPYLIVMNCPLEVYAKRSADFIRQKYTDAKIVFVRASEADLKFLSPLKAELGGMPGKDIYLPRSLKLDALKLALSPDKVNVLIVPSLDPVFWSRLMVYLGPMTNMKISIFAHPGFERMHFGNNQILQSLDIHFASNYFVDRKSQAVLDFVHRYKNQWATSPDEYAFRGFDIGMYFGSLVLKGQKVEDALSGLGSAGGSPVAGLSGTLEFKHYEGLGYINQAIKILSYGSGELEEAK